MRRSTLRLYLRQASSMGTWKPLRIENFINWKWRIENSIGMDFTDYTENIIPRWVWKASRGAACCASILPRQEKTPGNTINIFVILLIIIGLCETSLWGAARCASTVARQVPWIHGNRWELKIHSVRISWNLFVRHTMWVEAQRAAPLSQRDRKKRRETQ